VPSRYPTFPLGGHAGLSGVTMDAQIVLCQGLRRLARVSDNVAPLKKAVFNSAKSD